MTVIGIDPSLNSTGICVIKDGVVSYHIITPHITKTQAQCNFITYCEYQKTKGGEDYAAKEANKTRNLMGILSCLRCILKNYFDAVIVMEGVSYGSIHSAAIVDLAGLNFAIRVMCTELGHTIRIVSPMEVKKFAVGNGSAHKEQMIDAWNKLEGHKNDCNVKVDDVADAFFMAQMGVQFTMAGKLDDNWSC